MNFVTPTGENLLLIIKCEYLPHNDWMSFFTWYSIQKNLPDAKVLILCKRNVYKQSLFNWTYKYKVPIFQISSNFNDYSKIGADDSFHKIELTCEQAAINTFDEKNLGLDEEKEFCTFFNYFNKCGSFKGQNWVDSLNSPFKKHNEFITDDISLNEFKILKLWKDCYKLFYR